ncbi:MAG: PHD zinc finger domain-containing protein [Proteobacteria bacterium]|nr:PHD zinc finger domain-containing protein [Pseudomonadota bacterium]
MEKSVIQAALKGGLIEEESIECRPEKVSNAVLDENVDIHLIRSYLSQEAWMIVQDVLQRKREFPSWTCRVCHHDLRCEASIICESCLEWYHFRCVGLTGQPKKKELVLPFMSLSQHKHSYLKLDYTDHYYYYR